MSTWESSRESERTATDISDRPGLDINSHDDQWKALKQEILQSDEEDAVPTGTDLHLPALSSNNKAAKAPKKAKKSAADRQPKPKQKTLAQSLSDNDMEKLFSKFWDRDTEEEEGDVDISKFLQDDDDDSSDDETDGAAVNANDFFAKLTEDNRAGISASASAIELKKEDTFKPTEGPLVTLEDEKLAFSTENALAKKTIIRKSNNNNAPSYLVVDTPEDEVRLSSKFQPSVAPQPIHPAMNVSDGLFYWFDAKEQPYTHSVDRGSVFLFGKTFVEKEGRYCSCCARVHDVYRCVFLLPAPNSSQEDVLNEVNELCRISNINTRRIKFVERYYAFEEEGLPREKTTWVKLRYPGKYPPLALKGQMKHIQKVLGATSSLLELFLIKRKLRGPSYLRISDLVPAKDRVSHCDLEFVVDSPKKIHVDETPRPVPPFTLASVQLHAQLDSKGVTNEIIGVSIAVYRNTNIEESLRTNPDETFTGIRQLSPNAPLPMDLENHCVAKGLKGVHRFQNEQKLLLWMSQLIGIIDPDIWVGHNFLGFTLDTLLRRFQDLNISGWSTIGRLDLKRCPRLQSGSNNNMNLQKETCVGRLVADSYLLAREYYKTVNYKLQPLAKELQLEGMAQGGSFEPGSSTLLPDTMTSSQELFKVLSQICNCTVLSTAIINHVDAIRLTKRLTSIAGNLWSRTLYGARSERIEYLLLHTFHDLKFITPDKKTFDYKRQRGEDDADDGKRKAKYQGGMVLDPKCGLYSDYVLLLDFNSLYPSLIQEFNICYTTVDRTEGEDTNIPPPENLICRSCAAAGGSSPCLHKCILPKVIKGLVDSRRDVKKLMKSERDPNNLALLEIRQKALKLTANSMYGCLGFEHSRFHAQPLAELVTRQGRLALQNTVDLIPQISPTLRVIYGDTDSVMIQTGVKDDIKAVRDMGLEIKAKVNKRYQSLEIDIDGVFRAILLLKKKKYAALTVTDWQEYGTTYKREVKGLDMVRRDWCPLSKQVSDAVLNRVLHAEGSEDILDYLMKYMQDVAEHVRAGDRYTLADFVISKSLTKEPEAYRGTAFPHATVALRMKQRKELVRVGDLIPYVICDGEKLSEKAYHVDEVRHNPALRIDAEWYLSAQIYPPVMRLCEHIQGFSHVQLSQAMGIACNETVKEDADKEFDVNDFTHSSMFKNIGLSECFPTAVQLQVQCTHCLRKSPIDPHQRVKDVMTLVSDGAGPSRADEVFDLYICTSCGRNLPIDVVANYFNQTCYSLLKQFYESGGSATAVRAIRQQFTYFRALFDVPFAPGCPQREKDWHRCRVRRCLGTDGKLYTIEEAGQPSIASLHEPVDPLHASAETFYKRIDHLFVNLDTLFE